ncbi:MAG: cupin domain-containing protein [Anaerolineales bacterium]|nr:MAG: cupin domain-containing protein [Anaerolineales bacterium]
MTVHKVDVEAVAKGLERPFLMQQIAQVDHFGVHLYLCRGAVARHRHVTQDELFYVHSGSLALDTDWGHITLSRREFAVVPQGLAHVSGSIAGAVIMLFQARGDPDRKNGHGRLTLDPGTQLLPKWSVDRAADRLRKPYLPLAVAQVDEMRVRVVWCLGETNWHVHPDHDEMLLITDGRLNVATPTASFGAKTDELLVIPRRRIHRLTSSQDTIVLSLIHGEVTLEAHMGR